MSFMPKNLTEQEITKIAMEFMKKLNGIPLGEALYCLEHTKELLLDSHVVDINSSRFEAMFEELKAFVG